MGRKPLPLMDRKNQLTIRLPYWMILDLRKYENYNKIIEIELKKMLKNDENNT